MNRHLAVDVDEDGLGGDDAADAFRAGPNLRQAVRSAQAKPVLARIGPEVIGLRGNVLHKQALIDPLVSHLLLNSAHSAEIMLLNCLAVLEVFGVKDRAKVYRDFILCERSGCNVGGPGTVIKNRLRRIKGHEASQCEQKLFCAYCAEWADNKYAISAGTPYCLKRQTE